LSEPSSLAGLIGGGLGGERVIATRDHVLRLGDFERASSLASDLDLLRDKSVLLAVRDMAKAAAALIDLDGLARRIVLCPPGWEPERLEGAARATGSDALVYDGDDPCAAFPAALLAPCRLPLTPLPRIGRAAMRETEWILPTSGTTGPPKFVVHTLETLAGAIGEAPLQHWATFYDIRRYGGLQILLRALKGRGSLVLGSEGEDVRSLLSRFGEAGATHISGTPTHWRKVLMSGEGGRIDPQYVRLSGEIADDAVLGGLRALYPRARIEHAYASTEVGVVFAVSDERAGFPASWVDRTGEIRTKVVDGAFRVRSPYRALRFLQEPALSPLDEDGYFDTGDMVEMRGDRYLFVGRRSGVINIGGLKVHPEEVEAALNVEPAVRASKVFSRRNPITGALVFADVVLREGFRADESSEREILAGCRKRLAPHAVPVGLRFVADLPMTDSGKIARNG